MSRSMPNAPQRFAGASARRVAWLVPLLLVLAATASRASTVIDSRFNRQYRSPATCEALAVQPDGKIIFGGSISFAGSEIRANFARLNADGTLDTTFVRNDLGGIPFSVVVQSDGKIMVGGNFNSAGTMDVPSRMLRFNSDGTTDTTFRDPGLAANSNTGSMYVQKLLVLADGKYLIGGEFEYTVNGKKRFNLARLNSDGTLDPTFFPADVDGQGPNGLVRALVELPDGKVLVGGNFQSYSGGATIQFLTRINTDGTVDSAFTAAPVDDAVYDILRRADGTLLVGGIMANAGATPVSNLVLLTADGAPDSSAFNTNLGTGFNNGVLRLAQQNDGKLLVAGEFTAFDGTTRRGLLRLNADGALDSTLDPGTSLQQTGLTSDTATPTALIPLSDGNILAGATYGSTATQVFPPLFRFTSTGSLDPSFQVVVGEIGVVNTVTFLGDQVLLAGLFQAIGSERATSLDLIGPDLAPVAGFDYTKGPNNRVRQVLVNPNTGSLTVLGRFFQYAGATRRGIVRLNSDFTVDTTFNPGGAGLQKSDNTARDVAGAFLDATGRAVVAGDFNRYNGAVVGHLIRINTDGTLDTTFNAGGAGFNARVTMMVRLSDGSMLVSGSTITTYNGTAIPKLVKLSADGGLDPTFNAGAAGPDTAVSDVLELSSGKLLLAGDFTSYNGTAVKCLALINPDGTLDPSLNLSFGASSDGSTARVSTLALQADGKVLIGGGFTALNGGPQTDLARLNADLTVDPVVLSTGADFGANEIYIQSPKVWFVVTEYGFNGQISYGVTRLLVVPDIRSASPASLPRGSAGQTIALTGNDFTPDTVFHVNGAARTTTITSTTQGTVALTAEDLATIGTLNITAVVPDPDGSTSAALAFPVLNNPPVLGSAEISFNPNPAVVRQAVAFSIAAMDSDSQTLTYAWAFGDGQTSSAAAPSITYMATGDYAVSVTISDGAGGSVSASLALPVRTVDGGTDTDADNDGISNTVDLDDDNDGFSDELETFADTDPLSSLSTPTGAKVAPTPLPLAKLALALDFTTPARNKDSIAFSGTLPVTQGFVLKDQNLILDVGGVFKNVTLTDKGRFKSGKDTFALSAKAKKKVVQAQNAKFAAKLAAGSFASALADEGLTATDTDKNGKSVTVRVNVVFNDTLYQKDQALTYTAARNKGRTKQPKTR